MAGERIALRRVALGVIAFVAAGTALLGAGVGAAHAHPLGNATVNHYDGLEFRVDRVVDHAVEDVAEIPTLQRAPRIDSDHNGTVSAPERAAYAARQCATLAASNRLTVDGARAPFVVDRAGYVERPGAIGLAAGRLECDLTARVDLRSASTVGFDARWDSAGIGWHEITATAVGVTLSNSPFPAASLSAALTAYPNDLLSAPLDVRSGSVATTPGSAPSSYAAVAALPGAGVAVRAIDRLTKVFDEHVGARHLTVGVVLVTLLLAMVLGAGHACLPGHGKTIMAAYLVGRRGRTRDVVAVGATVTVTHTASVLVLGLLISVSSAFAPTAAEQTLAVVSGLIVVGVGLALLVAAARRARAARRANVVASEALVTPVREFALVAAGGHDVHTDHDHEPHEHEHHEHEHEHHGHDHEDGASPHSHGLGTHSHEPGAFGRGGLVGLGVAGGLVPSPSALLVLLAAIALGRGAFGVVLVLAYGLGMAGTLSAAGLLLVRLRDRLARVTIADRVSSAARFIVVLPFVTAALVLVVGVLLTVRAMHGAV